MSLGTPRSLFFFYFFLPNYTQKDLLFKPKGQFKEKSLNFKG